MEMLNEIVIKYIKPELLVLVLALYGLGIVIKHTSKISDKFIPLTLCVTGILLSVIWCLSTSVYTTIPEICACIFTSITQGILCASVSVFTNQLLKQSKKAENQPNQKGE